MNMEALKKRMLNDKYDFDAIALELQNELLQKRLEVKTVIPCKVLPFDGLLIAVTWSRLQTWKVRRAYPKYFRGMVVCAVHAKAIKGWF
jgi:hypothetical protein